MEKRVKVGLVGASAKGGWSPVAHIPALKCLENVELTALCTSRPESAKAAAEAFGVNRVYSNVKELVTQKDLDVISVVVKIPNHFEVVKAALEAEKHVYCEWPLGANLEETEELAKLAEEKGLITAIGLQGHHAPEFLFIKELIDEGWFGKVHNVNMSMQTKTSKERPSKKAWEEERERRATLFSIAGGHTLYYLSNIFGGINEVHGLLSTQFKELTLQDTGKTINNDIPDHIHIQGYLKNGVPFKHHIVAVLQDAKGWRLEINGTEGSLVATSAMLPQLTPIDLKGSKINMPSQAMKVPDHFIKYHYLPQGPAGNVGRNYGSMAEAIVGGNQFHPNFTDAFEMHKLLETIQKLR